MQTCRWQQPRGCGDRCHLPHVCESILYACSSKRLKEDVNDGSLRGLLASHGVVAYLCGHLHGLFGQRQHLLHLGVGSGEMCCERPYNGSGRRRTQHHALATNSNSTERPCSPLPVSAWLLIEAQPAQNTDMRHCLRCTTDTYSA